MSHLHRRECQSFWIRAIEGARTGCVSAQQDPCKTFSQGGHNNQSRLLKFKTLHKGFALTCHPRGPRPCPHLHQRFSHHLYDMTQTSSHPCAQRSPYDRMMFWNMFVMPSWQGECNDPADTLGGFVRGFLVAFAASRGPYKMAPNNVLSAVQIV